MKKLFSAAALALFASTPALATTFVVDFEKTWDFAAGDVNSYYNGGTAADGTSGPYAGVSFLGVSGLSNDASFTYYTGAPSMQGTAYAHTFALGDTAFMNVAAGGSDALSFYYSSPASIVGAVRAYSGLNGTGTLLGSIDLAANAGAGYDNWTPVSLSFNGIARSFDLTAGANVVALDNIGISAVPEPGTVLMMLVGGAAALRARSRRRA